MTAICRHWWKIDTPDGPTVEGKCKLCGEEKTFSSSSYGGETDKFLRPNKFGLTPIRPPSPPTTVYNKSQGAAPRERHIKSQKREGRR